MIKGHLRSAVYCKITSYKIKQQIMNYENFKLTISERF